MLWCEIIDVKSTMQRKKVHRAIMYSIPVHNRHRYWILHHLLHFLPLLHPPLHLLSFPLLLCPINTNFQRHKKGEKETSFMMTKKKGKNIVPSKIDEVTTKSRFSIETGIYTSSFCSSFSKRSSLLKSVIISHSFRPEAYSQNRILKKVLGNMIHLSDIHDYSTSNKSYLFLFFK